MFGNNYSVKGQKIQKNHQNSLRNEEESIIQGKNNQYKKRQESICLNVKLIFNKLVTVSFNIKFLSLKSLALKGTFEWANGESFNLPSSLFEDFRNLVNKKAKGKYFIDDSPHNRQIKYTSKLRSMVSINSLPTLQNIVLKQRQKIYQILLCYSQITGYKLVCHSAKALRFTRKIKIKAQSLNLFQSFFSELQPKKLQINSQKHSIKLKTQNQSPKQSSLLHHFLQIQQQVPSNIPFTHLPESKKFNFDVKVCKLKKDDGVEESKLLTIKQVSDGEVASKKKKEHLQRQWKIVNEITGNPKFFLQYLSQQASEAQDGKAGKIYMETVPDTLGFAISKNIFTLEQKLHLFRKIVEGINQLLNSGVIHRDLKPYNILLNDTINNKEDLKSWVKIIDFSDSVLTKQPYSIDLSNNLGITLPYSPFECYYHGEKGMKGEYIDMWSLGIVLFELIFSHCPGIQTTYLFQEFKEGIKKNQFTFSPFSQKMNRKGVHYKLLKYLSLFMTRLIQFSPQNRLNILSTTNISKIFQKWMILQNIIH